MMFRELFDVKDYFWPFKLHNNYLNTHASCFHQKVMKLLPFTALLVHRMSKSSQEIESENKKNLLKKKSRTFPNCK